MKNSLKSPGMEGVNTKLISRLPKGLMTPNVPSEMKRSPVSKDRVRKKKSAPRRLRTRGNGSSLGNGVNQGDFREVLDHDRLFSSFAFAHVSKINVPVPQFHLRSTHFGLDWDFANGHVGFLARCGSTRGVAAGDRTDVALAHSRRIG